MKKIWLRWWYRRDIMVMLRVALGIGDAFHMPTFLMVMRFAHGWSDRKASKILRICMRLGYIGSSDKLQQDAAVKEAQEIVNQS